MRVRNFAPNTQESYLHQVSLFARHFGKSPEQLGPEEIRAYRSTWLTRGRYRWARESSQSARCGSSTASLCNAIGPSQLIPTPKKDHRLPVILSPQEVLQLLQAAPSFPHHVIFSTMYGTGMRVSEAVHLRADQHRQPAHDDPHRVE